MAGSGFLNLPTTIFVLDITLALYLGNYITQTRDFRPTSRSIISAENDRAPPLFTHADRRKSKILSRQICRLWYLDFKICQAKLSQFESKHLHFGVFESESTLFQPKIFMPDNQDPIFADYGYDLKVNYIYVCMLILVHTLMLVQCTLYYVPSLMPVHNTHADSQLHPQAAVQ